MSILEVLLGIVAAIVFLSFFACIAICLVHLAIGLIQDLF